IPAFQENGRFVLQRYQDYLKRSGSGLEADFRRQMTRAKVETAIRNGVKVSETELEQAFRLRREEVRAAWALVELAPIVAGANAGADFGKQAQDLSEDSATAQRGGDLGLVGKGEIVPEFERALFALKKGEVSPEPVRTPFGFHAIKAIEIQEGGRKPLKEVAP